MGAPSRDIDVSEAARSRPWLLASATLGVGVSVFEGDC